MWRQRRLHLSISAGAASQPSRKDNVDIVDNQKKMILARLKRIEGQVRGVQNMISEERDCRDVMQQMQAIKSAVQQASVEILREHAETCLNDDRWDKSTRGKMLDDLLTLAGRNG